MTPETTLLTPRELAALAGVSTSLVYTWCAAGELAHVRLGAPGRRGKIMIAESDLRAFLAARRVVAKDAANGLVRPAVPATRRFRHLKLA